MFSAVPLQNPRNILEATDGSDDKPTPRQLQQAEPARDEDDDVKIVNNTEEDSEESEEAELSVFQFSTIKKLLTCHQNISWVNGPHQFMCSSGKHPTSNILMTVVELMCLNVLLGGARERTGEMFATTSTKVTGNQQVTFVSMPKFAGVPTQLKWQMRPMTLTLHARSCPRLNCEIGQSLLNLHKLGKGK